MKNLQKFFEINVNLEEEHVEENKKEKTPK